MVVEKYPHIHQIGCSSHQFDLVIKDILQLPELDAKMKEAIELAKWYRNRHVPMAELRVGQQELYKKEIALSLPVAARWQSRHDCLKTLLQSREALEQVAVMSNIRQEMSKKEAGQAVRMNILSDDWWDSISRMEQLVRPFIQVTIAMESNTPKLFHIYNNFAFSMKPLPRLKFALILRSGRQCAISSKNDSRR